MTSPAGPPPGGGGQGFDQSRLDAIRAQLDKGAATRPSFTPPPTEPYAPPPMPSFDVPKNQPSPTPSRPAARRPDRAPAPKGERPRWQLAALIIGCFTALLYVIEFVDALLNGRLDAYGIQPLSLGGLSGILFAPMLHDGWDHLAANTIPLAVLGFLTLMTGIKRGLLATAIIWVIGGLGTWLTGGLHTNHLGASVLVFGWLAYLLVRGIFTRSFGQIALGVVILIIYGSLLWGVLPGDPGVSWQGHMFGAIGGVVAAWVLSSEERGARRAKAAHRSILG